MMWYKRHLVLLPLSAMVWGRMREKEKDRNEHRRRERKKAGERRTPDRSVCWEHTGKPREVPKPQVLSPRSVRSSSSIQP